MEGVAATPGLHKSWWHFGDKGFSAGVRAGLTHPSRAELTLLRESREAPKLLRTSLVPEKKRPNHPRSLTADLQKCHSSFPCKPHYLPVPQFPQLCHPGKVDGSGRHGDPPCACTEPSTAWTPGPRPNMGTFLKAVTNQLRKEACFPAA